MNSLTNNFLRLILFLLTPAAFGQWTQTAGPTGAISHEIIYLGSYLFVNGYDGGVYRSADNGQTWQAANTGLPPDFRCVAMDAENDKLYIATEKGIFYSEDFGASWTSMGHQNLGIFSLEISGTEIFAGLQNGQILYSPDHGLTWVLHQNVQFPQTARQLFKFANILWIGTTSNFYASSDNGTTWYKPGLDLVITDFTNDGTDLYVSGNAAGIFTVFKTSDAGSTWVTVKQTTETNLTATGFTKAGNELYIAGASALYYSGDNGNSWATHPYPKGYTIYGQSFVAIAATNLFISYSDGILLSPDKGITWQRRNIGYRNHTIPNIQATSGAIVSLSLTNGVFVSPDQGATWEPVHDPDRFLPYQIYVYENTILINYGLSIYKSTTNGATWLNIFNLDISGATEIPTPHLTGSGRNVVYSTFRGLYISTDLGATWNLESTSLLGTDDTIFKSFIQHDTILVMGENEIFYSTDLANTWQKRPKPEDVLAANSFVTGIVLHRSSILMSTYNGFFRSSDFGATWKNVPCIPHPLIFEMKKIGEYLIHCTYEGVFISPNGGIDWYAARDGLGVAQVQSILVTDMYSYAGSWGKGVWRIPTPQLFTPGEFLALGGEPVDTPTLSVDCSTLTVENPTPEVEIKWYRDGSVIPGENKNTLSALIEGVYTVSFENSCDLKYANNIEIKKNEKISVPLYNIITANGDGKNDHYVVDSRLSGSRLQIFNRWGEIVFSSAYYQNDWAADQLSPGMYFYHIQSPCYGDFKGPLTVLKP